MDKLLSDGKLTQKGVVSLTIKSSETQKVREGEELNSKNLLKYLQENIEGLPNEMIEINQFSAGHSNLTYCLKIGSWEAVLRRPPLGPVAPKAHDMEREHLILSELNPLYPLAPKPYKYCGDPSIIGAPFILMERKRGIVLDTHFPGHIEPEAEEKIGKFVSETMIEQLVALHRIDYKQTKLAKISRPDGFLERQVHGWIGRYERAKTDEVKGVAKLQKWLTENIPTSLEPTIIHYDYKLNNAMFSPLLDEMVGLFDWEMTTVGDPLADLGVSMSYWIKADDSEQLISAFGQPSITVKKGFLTRDQCIELYAKKSGRDVSNIHFYMTFAYFKLAVICQQIYYRFNKGQTNDSRFRHFNVTVNALIQHAILTSSQKE